MTKQFLLLLMGLMAFSTASFAKSLSCDNGFLLDSETRTLVIDQNDYTKQLESYLVTDYSHKKMYAAPISWSDFHNAYFKSDSFSTVKVYYYQNGEKAVSLVAEHAGEPVKQIKFGNCNF
jgi:hypothetical protein